MSPEERDLMLSTARAVRDVLAHTQQPGPNVRMLPPPNECGDIIAAIDLALEPFQGQAGQGAGSAALMAGKRDADQALADAGFRGGPATPPASGTPGEAPIGSTAGDMAGDVSRETVAAAPPAPPATPPA